MKILDVKKLTDKKLEEVYAAVVNELHSRKTNVELVEIKRKMDTSMIQFRVHYWNEDPADKYGPYFSFYVVDGKKLLDFYEDFGDDKREELAGLIPKGFAEAMENAYEYHGSVKDAITKLKAAGFIDIVEGMPSFEERS